MTTDDPTIPELGLRLLMLGGGITVKLEPLLWAPPEVVTTTFPVVAPAGAVAVMLLALQALIVAAVPLNVTVPCDVPKFDPAMTTADPTAPVFGVRLLMLGVTVNVTPLLAWPLTVTMTLPVVAPAGTGTVIELALQLVGVADVPLKVTELVPWDAPKFEPAMTTEDPTAPVLGVRLLMLGVLPGGNAIAAADSTKTTKFSRVYSINRI